MEGHHSGEERGRIEEALRKNEGWFRSLTEGALDIVMVTGSDGTIRYISPSVQSVLGYTPENIFVEGFSAVQGHSEDCSPFVQQHAHQ